MKKKMEGTGLFGAGNKSGKISRFKKANKWTGFSEGVVNKGMDLGERALDILINKKKDNHRWDNLKVPLEEKWKEEN